MKYVTFVILIIYLMFPVFLQGQITRGRISLSGAFALYPMAVKWAEEFRKVNPRVKIDISAGGAGKGVTDVLNNMVDIAMVSRDVSREELNKGALPIAVCRDAVVGVVNSSNPVLNEILTQGLTSETAGGIWITGIYKKWNQVYAAKTAAPIHVYTRSDACGAAETWSAYLKSTQEELLGSAVYGDPGLALAIRKDPVGIGFNNICYAYDFMTRKPFKGIRVVPLDLNKNGKIDPGENFYNTLDLLIRAIADGKYPSPPSRELYFVVHRQTKNKLAAEFLKWVLTAGQKFVAESGCINLSEQQLAEQLRKVN